MWIGVFDLAARKQSANFGQFVDDHLVGSAFAALTGQDVVATKQRQVIAEFSVVCHVVRDDLLQHAKVTIKLVFLHPVRRRTMHEPGAFFVTDKVCGTEIAQVIPFAFTAFNTVQRVRQFDLR